METPTAEQVKETIERRVPEGLQGKGEEAASGPTAGLTLTGIMEEMQHRADLRCVSSQRDLAAGRETLALGMAAIGAAFRERAGLLRDYLAQQPDELQALREAVRRAASRIATLEVPEHSRHSSTAVTAFALAKAKAELALLEEARPHMGEQPCQR